MSEIINLHLADDIIDFTAERLLKLGADAALISGGRRPFLFIRKALAGKIKKASFAQECFTRDEFIDKLIFNNSRLSKISQTEGAYILFEIIKEKFPDILKGRRTFAEFFKWAVEILSFIDNSLLEDVSGSALKNIERNADIGYEVPRNINDLLKNIFNLRESFLYALGKKNLTMRGLSYLLAGKMSAQELCCGFDKIILLAPFYMHKTELVIFKKIYDEGKLTVILQGDPRKYAALKEIYDFFGENLPQINKTSESK
ncbi:MAG: hypothetical protein LBQ47_07505, partial [Endomicrobium sp.]|nr:hypothetical protein [Endomicrobium sp.]